MNRKHDGALVGAIEAGGTKFVCAVGTGPDPGLLAREELPTAGDPSSHMAAVVEWFQRQQQSHGRLNALGVATFGPVDLDEGSATYGFITSTPKPGWANADLLGPLRAAFGDLPMAIDTDVNGAALGEHVWGAARDLTDFVYVTMGTGIGGGGMARGRLLHGLVHPEMGHMRLPRLAGDSFAGICPYHGDCWEGLCCGPAIDARTGMAAGDLPADHPAWQTEARYVAAALANIVCVLSPQRIILGGSLRKAGKLGQDAFFRLVREGLQRTLAGYVVSPALLGHGVQTYLVPPQLGDDAGVCGAIALAQASIR